MAVCPQIALVLPFRNARRWLPHTLHSLQQQKLEAVELVAVDDGSVDGSADLLLRLWSPQHWPLKFLRLDSVGVSTARNAGWRAASAPLVAFLDADDLALPGRLTAQMALLQSDTTLAHCLGGWWRIDAAGLPLVEVRPWQEGAGFTLELALRHKAVLPSAWMLRREALEAVGGFDPALSHAEDVDLLLRLAAAGQRGAWLQQPVCGYRVHAGGASRQVRAQSHSLLWAVERQLHRLPPTPEAQRLAREVRYATRAWAGWKAWVEQQPELALTLWRSSLALTPLPPARTWLHMAENIAVSCQREGRSFSPQALLADPLWQQLEQHWLARWSAPELARRRVRRLRRDLQQQLGESPQASPWWPGRLRAQLQPDDPLRALRERVLEWSERLLTSGSEDRLAQDLNELLLAWVRILWPEDPRASRRMLEQVVAIHPQPEALRTLAQLQQRRYPIGAQALRQLAARLAPLQEERGTSPSTEHPFWQRLASEDVCTGPSCAACAHRWLFAWEQRELTPGCVRWLPPKLPANGLLTDPPFAVQRLPSGRAWLRIPSNPWGLTHGLGVSGADGTPLARFCRRYPQPWPTCTASPGEPEPEPLPLPPPQWIAGRVVAVADLSAENHYHWLVDALPRLGRALEILAHEGPINDLRIWHNGGDGPIVRECLVELLGLQDEQLLDAHRHPTIQAEVLLVPDFAGAFAIPAPASVRWWRQQIQRAGWLAAEPRPAVKPSILWWWRGSEGWRRPVWGERDTLDLLARQRPELSIEVVNADGLSLREQARQWASADLVVIPHGAGLANLLFSKPGTRVLELHSSRYAPPYSHGLAQHLGLKLWTCEQPETPPGLYQELLYEGAVLEPLCLDPALVAGVVLQVLAGGDH